MSTLEDQNEAASLYYYSQCRDKFFPLAAICIINGGYDQLLISHVLTISQYLLGIHDLRLCSHIATMEPKKASIL